MVGTLYPWGILAKISHNPTSSTNNEEPLFSRRKEISSAASTPDANFYL